MGREPTEREQRREEAERVLWAYQDEVKLEHCGSVEVSMATVWARMTDEQKQRMNVLCQAAGYTQW